MNTYIMRRIKSITLFVSLLFLILYIPLTIAIYSQSWYEFNYRNNTIDSKTSISAIENVISFFLYKDKLDLNIWSKKEIRHFSDVRNIYLFLHIFALLSFCVLLFLFDKRKMKKISTYIFVVILLLGTLFYFIDFSYFWNNIFHNILFYNQDWIYTQNEMSYFLFPESFFVNSVVLIILGGMIINLLLFLYSLFSSKLNLFSSKP